MTHVRAFLASMSGRIFLILLFGVALSASAAWTLAEGRRQADIQRIGVDRTIDRLQAFIAWWQGASAEERARIGPRGVAGVRFAPVTARATGPDFALTTAIAARLGDGVPIMAQRADIESCRPQRLPGERTPTVNPNQDGPSRVQLPVCWLVTVGADGETLRLVVETPLRVVADPLLLDPVYLAILALAAAVLAFFVARMAARPINALAEAAGGLGQDLSRAPIPIAGPAEVREAARAFNAMQTRLKRQLSERTHMLAAITHDLQTPVTRLRLRLEKVEDEALRERLLADLAAMQGLIREGLDLARTAESAEVAVTIDLASLLHSVVDDAADAGQAVRLAASLTADVRGRPQALRRCLANLIDNALKYGGSAEVSAELAEGGKVVVRVRDHGPGLPDAHLESVFDPFVRLEDSRSRDTGGVGLGLTIARMLAERDGARISLRNHPDGGAEAVLELRAG